MSFLKDIIDFERFNLRDMGKKIKKDPERLLLGAVDPWSTKLWNQTGIGKDWEPLVDQMGGAYGGSALTLGDTGEGVYGRAAEKGIPTEAGAGMHDIAHVISSIFAGGYGADKLGLGGAGGFRLPGIGGQQQQPQQPPPYMSGFQPQSLAPQAGMADMLRRNDPRTQAMLAALLRGRNV